MVRKVGRHCLEITPFYNPFFGLPRYPSPYPLMVRPGFPQRPIGPMGVLPRPPIPGVPGVPGIRPIMPLIVRPVIPSIATEKPQTTVYVGKISPTVENNFILALLQLCGPVKSWKRAQDPSNGAPRGFGFCEFESAEGVLRALRLLSKFNIDGQELVLNVNQATRDYLERYVEKKTENSKKLKETEAPPADKEGGEGVANDEKNDQPKPTASEEPKESNDSENKENSNENFGIVTDEDKEADRGVMEKLASMVEERLKAKPLPPPPALTPADNPENSNSEVPVKSRDGDSDPDTKNDMAELKNDDESTAGDNKRASENNDRAETSSPDRSRRHDRRSRERDRDRDLKREKDREIERYERETERERVRKERDQRRKIEDADRQYDEYVREWEYREREREKQRHYEKEREKEKERKRKKEIAYEEDDNEDDEDSRKRWRRSALEEKRKKRMREKEDDLLDKQREEEEEIAAAAEAERREEEEKLKQQQEEEEEARKSLSDRATSGTEKVLLDAEESGAELKDTAMEEGSEDDSDHENHPGGVVAQNGSTSDELTAQPGPTKKLGFGLVGSGKRTAVASVFKYEEEDEEARKENKMRPLVPIDYSTEELQAVQTPGSGSGSGPGSGPGQPNLAAAAEFAKRIVNERPDPEKERSTKRSRHGSNSNNNKTHEADHGHEKGKASAENKKLVDAKQLIDMIPKTKDELFSYKINWAIYDEHALHERMRPWISKKITEFLGEEEATLVDYIVSSTQEHVEADHMLQLLQSILDEEAEMFVLKMWRMLIFEIKKVESGLGSRTRT